MEIIEVKDKKTKSDFLDVVEYIYKGDDVYVRPLDIEIKSVFNPQKNVFFENGEAIRWILVNDQNQTIGRIAAFINRNKAFSFDQPTGGMGFFECINDKDAALLLLNTAQKWLQDREMEAMDAPINFGENDRFWGLLVSGFTHPGIGMTYNPTYYKDFFEDFGFKPYFEQISNHLDLTKKFPERFWKIAEWVAKKPQYRFENFSWDKVDKYVADFEIVYNEAWQFHENFTSIQAQDLKRSLNEFKPFMEEEFIWYVYADDKPIAFLIMLPDANQIIKHLNGKSTPMAQLKFLKLKKKKTINRSRIVIMGVVPKYQKSGIESAIFQKMDVVMKKPEFSHYKEIELSWVGDFNPKMRQLHESVGATFGKKHITYRKVFSNQIEAKRSKIIATDTKEKYVK